MNKIVRFFCGALCIIAIAVILISNINKNENNNAEQNEIQTLTLWQIDSFEGGTGSRASYIQEKGNNYKKINGEYINVITLSADAARLNIENGNTPDIISFGGGEWGIESTLNTNYQINCWCYGSYCLLAIGDNIDFSEATAQNTVINTGRSNLSQAAALLCGLEDATMQNSTYAYVDLINGKYKFLLGTQRDIYRLNARKVSYSINPIIQFNDLYQLIAVCTKDAERAKASYCFIEYLLNNNSDVYKLGLLGGELGINEKIASLENLTFETTLNVPINEATKKELEEVIKLKDINKLKTLLK